MWCAAERTTRSVTRRRIRSRAKRRALPHSAVFAALLGFALSAAICLAQTPFTGAWSVRQLAAAEGPLVPIADGDGNVVRSLSVEQMRLLYAVDSAIKRAAEIDAEFVVVDGTVPNAFAGTLARGRNVVGINFAMLDVIGNDMHAAAALLGHELAHLKLEHGERTANKRATTGVLGALGGIVLGSLGVPAGQAISSLTVNAVQSGYSRDNEREADYLGAIWAVEAGFEAEGAVRLHEAINRLDSGRGSAFFSTHPSGPERIATLRSLANRLAREPAPR